MNDQISWDHSLVKKYSSSNHFKLLNQLRAEVKKYPLINKKKMATNLSNSNKSENNKNVHKSITHETSISTNDSNDTNLKKSTVSFNNSKNFSIYKTTSDSKNEQNEQNELNILGEKKLNENKENSNFKDRLSQIDMK